MRFEFEPVSRTKTLSNLYGADRAQKRERAAPFLLHYSVWLSGRVRNLQVRAHVHARALAQSLLEYLLH